jgi:hypothetical protein
VGCSTRSAETGDEGVLGPSRTSVLVAEQPPARATSMMRRGHTASAHPGMGGPGPLVRGDASARGLDDPAPFDPGRLAGGLGADPVNTRETDALAPGGTAATGRGCMVS